MPYLHWDTYHSLQSRADVIQRRTRQPTAQPVDRSIATGSSIEHKLIWKYLDSEAPFHCRRTLDQYGYPTLHNTSVRDADQVLYKKTREPSLPQNTPLRNSSLGNIRAILHAVRDPDTKIKKWKAAADKNAKVLMVDQLWLWITDDENVMTFATPKEKEDDDGGTHKQGDVRSNIHLDITRDDPRRCDDCFDFAAVAIFHAVTALLEDTDDPSLQIFRIFEEYISELVSTFPTLPVA